jgi:hypothetical protein
MCANRLGVGEAPACVQSLPEFCHSDHGG